ncbi:MAG: ABC transporter permease [Candidatus Solibacter sp.]|nr:ABC transporter permease [Candidatus Solibacter sp.]
MTALRAFLFRLIGLFHKQRWDRELTEELENHLQMQIAANIRSGMTPAEARRAALLKSGGVELAKEEYRDRRGLPLLETAVRDLRHATRILRRSPASTGAAVGSLALGIAAITVIFSVQKGILLAPLPYPEPDRLVAVWQRPPDESGRQPLTSPDYFDYRERSRSFEELGVQALRPVNLSGEGTPERVPGSLCSASLLRAVGVPPAMGRLFTDREEAQKERVILLSHGLWQRRFGGDPNIVGRRIGVNGEDHTVVGVMPAGYQSPRLFKAETSAEVWTPAAHTRADSERASHWLAAIGRLKRGVSLQAADQDVREIAAALAKQYPRSSSQVSAWAQPLKALMVRDVRKPLWFLLGAVVALLAISCANVASIQFARSNGRHGEVAIRASLGAGRAQVARQFLTENLLLAGMGGVAGGALAIWGVALLRGMLPATIERASAIRIDGWVLLFTAGITMAAGLLSGLAPALSTARLDINSALRQGQGTLTAGRSRIRFQRALVVAQFALALVIANGAALMMKSYLNVVGTPAGFDADRTSVASIILDGPAYRGNAAAQAAFWNRLLERVRALPGVKQAGATTKLPLEGGTNGSYLVEAEQYDPSARRPLIERSWVTPEYFEAMGIGLLAGQLFAPGSATEKRAEIVVNRAFAREYFSGGTALGKRIYPNSAERVWVGVIVGVVEDVPQWSLEVPPVPEVYQLAESTARAGRHLIIRAAIPPLTLSRGVREAVASIDRNQAVSDMRTMEAVFDGSAARRRFNTVLMEIFAMLGLAMVIVGIYGVVSCWVAQRTREVGIRMALGAGRGHIVKMVVGRGTAMSALGILLGAAGSLALSSVVKSMLYGVSPTSPVTIVGVAFLLLLVALLGSALPALRAARVDPVRTLRAG